MGECCATDTLLRALRLAIFEAPEIMARMRDELDEVGLREMMTQRANGVHVSLSTIRYMEALLKCRIRVYCGTAKHWLMLPTYYYGSGSGAKNMQQQQFQCQYQYQQKKKNDDNWERRRLHDCHDNNSTDTDTCSPPTIYIMLAKQHYSPVFNIFV